MLFSSVKMVYEHGGAAIHLNIPIFLTVLVCGLYAVTPF